MLLQTSCWNGSPRLGLRAWRRLKRFKCWGLCAPRLESSSGDRPGSRRRTHRSRRGPRSRRQGWGEIWLCGKCRSRGSGGLGGIPYPNRTLAPGGGCRCTGLEFLPQGAQRLHLGRRGRVAKTRLEQKVDHMDEVVIVAHGCVAQGCGSSSQGPDFSYASLRGGTIRLQHVGLHERPRSEKFHGQPAQRLEILGMHTRLLNFRSIQHPFGVYKERFKPIQQCPLLIGGRQWSGHGSGGCAFDVRLLGPRAVGRGCFRLVGHSAGT